MPISGAIPRKEFIQLFTQEIGLDERTFGELCRNFEVRHIPRRGFHLSAGDVCTHTAYVNKGCSRSFTIDRQGKEHVLFFAFEDWWVGDYESYVTQRPAKQFIEAIEDLELLCIDHHTFERFGVTIPQLGRWHREKQVKMAFGMINRLIEVKSCTAEDRLRALVKQRPDIFQRVALHDIASYLDIEPPSLSRIRRRMVEADRLS
jgi:CRP-like cAMP-binding protein